MTRTLEQKRAEAAFQKVKRVADSNPAWAKDYGRQCRRLPTLILQTGLCQAVAFLMAKGHSEGTKESVQKSAFTNVLADLESIMGLSDGSLARRAREANLSVYRHDTIAALGCAHYLKRYAEAFDLGEVTG